MTRTAVIANSILWASAIIASAILGAPRFLTLVVLPTLAATSLIVSPRRTRAPECQPSAPFESSRAIRCLFASLGWNETA